jgi:hypothetical protein
VKTIIADAPSICGTGMYQGMASVMGNVSVVSVCDLSMIKAEYRHIEANGRSPFYGYRINVTLNGGAKAQFNVHQEIVDDFANEPNSLAALIRAHT